MKDKEKESDLYLRKRPRLEPDIEIIYVRDKEKEPDLYLRKRRKRAPRTTATTPREMRVHFER